MKILVIIACMFLVTVFVQSGDLKFDRLSINDGLSENVVYCILQDRKGFMWFGTHDGLNRYDGYTFKVFRSDPFDSTSLCNNMVTALHEDKSGRLWVGTYNGLSLFDAKTETFRSFYHDSTRASSLSFNQVNAMCEDKNGRLLFATSIGVNEMISEGQFRRYGSSNYLNDDVQSLFADSAGTVWVGTSQVVDTVDFNNHCLQTIFPVIHQALAITSDRRGRLLIGTFDKLILYGTNDKTMKSFTPDMHEKKTHSNNTVKYFLRDSDGSVWLGTYNGLMKFDANTLTAQRFFHEPADVQSLGSNKIYSLYEDHSGVLWVGTFGGGVSKTYLRQKKFTHYRIEPTDSTKIGLNMMMSVFEDRTGLLWLGTWDKGVVCFNRERESYQLFPSSLGVKRPSFEDSMGNIYSAENFHIVKYNRGTGIISSTELSFGTILCLLPDSDGSFWAGTSVGLVHFNLALDVIEVFKHNAKDTTSIGSGVVGSIAGDANGILWIGAGGLNRFDKKTGHFRNFKPDPGNKFRLCLDENIPIHVARDGRIWIGSRGNGLFCFTPATETFVRFTETDGLPNNYIYGILEDENRSLWISTNRGLCRFEPNAKTWKKYDVSDGLQSNEFNTGAYFKSRNGEFFFGGINGINSFFPHEIEDNAHIPNIVITGFRVFNKPYQLANVITETEEIQLPYDRNFFSFEFAALDYVNTRKNQYRYLLEGYDREWVDAGTTGVADYTDVHPGTYRFRILGSNNDGVWNEEGASIFITITPPYWATWWFRVMMGVLLVGSVSGITRYISVTRMKRTMKELEQQHALEKERLRISKDMHDDLGSRLTQIGLLSELAKRETQNPQHMERTLQEISGTTQDIVQSFDEIVWAVNPRYDTLEGMIDYLAQYAASYVENIGAECRVDLPSVEKSIHVSAEIRHNVFMIVKEALNNTAKYASATEVKFLPTFENQQFSLIIQDNGRGFAPDSVAQFSEGLHNMEKRMEEIGGTFFLTSAPGQGTTIKISVKVS